MKIGLPEIARVVCAMNKEHMTGFRHIQYTWTPSVVGGVEGCDYRLCCDSGK